MGGQPLERPGEVPTGTGDRCTTRAVVPICRREEVRAPPTDVQADEELFDEQAVVQQVRTRRRRTKARTQRGIDARFGFDDARARRGRVRAS
jgi:hypothetical protein